MYVCAVVTLYNPFICIYVDNHHQLNVLTPSSIPSASFSSANLPPPLLSPAPLPPFHLKVIQHLIGGIHPFRWIFSSRLAL